MKIRIGLVDDHQLFLKSLTLLLNSCDNFEVVLEALSGKELQEQLKLLQQPPDIMLIDVNMDEMNGVDVATFLHDKYPLMRLVALSMNCKENAILSMFRAGCCAYLLKDTHPTELEKALLNVFKNGFYHANIVHVNFGKLLQGNTQANQVRLTVKEQEFLKLACSDMTYKEIANVMKVAMRTVDGYRESLFDKLDGKSRVGLCLEAIKMELVKI